MRYWLLAVGGLLAVAASISATVAGLYGLLLIGSCASGGVYEIARPCPEGTGLRVALLVGGVLVGLVSLLVFAMRGYRGGEPASIGRAAWVLGFGGLAVAFLYAGFGPDAVEDESGWKLFSALMGGFFVLMALPAALAGRLGRGKREQAEKLLRGGVRAPAVVTAVEDTGMTVNDNPRVKMTFEIRPERGAPFAAEKTAVVSRVAIPRAGDHATAWYDPADPTTFMVSFDDPAKIDAGLAQMGRVVAPPPAPAPEAGSLADELRELGELRLKGVLTDEEFERAKARLLGAG
jgi:hypothetical protein